MSKTSYYEAPQVLPSNSPIPVVWEKESSQTALEHPQFGPGSDNEKAQAMQNKRRWPWVLAIVLAVLIALGVGIGIGYGAFHHSASQAEPSAASKPTPSAPSATPIASATQSSRPSNREVAAAFSCNDSLIDQAYLYTTPSGVRFHQDCYVDYPGGQDRVDGQGTVKDLGQITVYSFEECMDNCAAEPDCGALTFNANLTLALQTFGGDCFLKNARGFGTNDDSTGNDYPLLGSAYIIPS